MPYALITGASKGIGKAIAAELAARKNDLLLVARSESLLKETAASLSTRFGIKADYLAVDLSAPDAVSKTMNWLKEKNYEVNMLVNNAGYGLSGDFDTYTAEEHKAMMQVNMTVPVELTSALIPELKKHPRSYILNIASSAAYQSVPGLAVYAASKSFLLSFSRALHFELRKTTISVTAVSPGGTDTDFANRAQVSAKAVKAGQKLNMTPEAVARIAVNAMYNGKTEIITGFVNKLGAAFAWLLPKKLTESTAAGLYKKD
ncbi:SDR family oxidoreductase [Sediminibacterium roseum]|uniref:SDR family oxidoreductase n=1 Tax=Sediminibacterium roseum TaxID=1978412 RepID=A0ABW9ZS89_9BACT|nr:SDR family oxidoreductase [Sediminibacterium roseum]NCI49976.1 SDR family oxidoreductase [Sediminibacterium roseum]